MGQSPDNEAALLAEIARLTAALILVVRTIDDPQLKKAIADLLWPRGGTPDDSRPD